MEPLEIKYRNLGHLLDSAADRHADKPLFIFEDQVRTYAWFQGKVNRLANALQSLGLKKGDRVAVMLPNCIEFPTAWFAIAKSGAVMVPVNINYRHRDLEYVLSDSGATLMILHSDYLPLVDRVRAPIPHLQQVIALGDRPYPGTKSFTEIINTADTDFQMPEIGGNDLVNIQYTSGTTGFPKGCMLSHRYWLSIAQVAADYLTVTDADRDLTAQPFYYMDPQWNTVLCMQAGIALVVMKKFSVSRFWAEVQRHGVTFFYILGTMPVLLYSQPLRPEEQEHKVRAVICSGIYPHLHAEFEARWKTPWREAFGMTETGVDLLVPLDDMASVGSGAMGAPIPSKEARIVDKDDHPIPPGTVGELVVRGEPMMLGYWNRPEATAEAMRGGWLHTGDLAYKDERGYFHWVGRIKDMIRRHAENISSVEVEAVLAGHPKISAVAVVPVPDEICGEEVKAYLILAPGETRETVPPEEIVAYCRENLAKFKVPRYLEYRETLPMTPSERVQKYALLAEKDDLRADSYDALDSVWR
jgi:acyl-CoA synthetase (AMP-forming)/AMP-acid ligase II